MEDRKAGNLSQLRGRRLTAADLLRGPRNPVEIPEWADPETGEPGIVFVRHITAHQVIALSKGGINLSDAKSVLESDAIMGLIADMIVAEDGTRMFSPTDASDLRDADARIFMRLANAVLVQIGSSLGADMGGSAAAAEAERLAKEKAERAAAGEPEPVGKEPTPETPTPVGSDSPTA